MARRKVKLAWICNDSARRATYKKRQKGFLKKMSELSTLCDVQACAIMYGPCEPNLQVWPHNPEEIKFMLDRFMSIFDQGRKTKTLDQEMLMEQRLDKGRDQLKRIIMENQALESSILMHRCLVGQSTVDDISVDTLHDVHREIDMHIVAITNRLQLLETPVASSPMDATPLMSRPFPESLVEISENVGQEMQMVLPDETGREMVSSEDASLGELNFASFVDYDANGMSLSDFFDAGNSDGTTSNFPFPLLDDPFYDHYNF